jgi:hypothetical protein
MYGGLCLYATPIKNRCAECASSYYCQWYRSQKDIYRTQAQTACFAWALIPNHFLLLLKIGTTSISIVMRRLRKLKISQPAVSLSVMRGEQLVMISYLASEPSTL